MRWCGWFADESFRVCRVGGVEDASALVADGVGQAVVDVGCGVKRDPGMAMLVVVLSEEALAVQSGCLDRGERVGKLGRYFSVLNCDSE